MLLDEPSSGLDVRETAQLGEALRSSVEREHIAVLLVEHDLDLVLGLSELVYVIDFGRQIFEGTPAQTRRAEAVQAAYLGREVDRTSPPPEVDA